jgi:multiple sugar transport system substrate-binding protein
VWEAFNAEHDDIQAEYVAVGGGYGPQYLEALQTRIAANDAPDIFFVMDGYIAGFADRNVITPIDGYIESEGVDLSDFFDPHMSAFQFAGQLWGLPRDGAPFAMFYNAALFDEAGIAYPDETWTWDTYLEAAQAMTKRDEGGRALQLGADRGQWVDWVWQAGGEIFNEEQTQCLLDQPEAIAGLQFMQELVVTHNVAPSAGDLADQGANDMFLSGRLATYFNARGALGAICAAEFPFSAAVEPAGQVRLNRTNVGPTVLWSGSPNPDAAFALLNFICSTEGQRLKISSGYAFPSRRSAAEQEWLTEFQCGQSINDGINLAFLRELEEGWCRPWPTHARWPEIIDVINAEIDFLWSGEKSAEQVGQDIAAKVNPILAEAG